MPTLGAFRTDVHGNVAVMCAATLAFLMMIAGGTLDLMRVSNQSHQLQSIADNAALAAVRELSVVSNDPDRIQSYVDAFVAQEAQDLGTNVLAMVTAGEQTVTVALMSDPLTYFPGPFSSAEPVNVTATARLSGKSGNICLIGLSNGVKRTLTLNHDARLTAGTCAIYSNSIDKQSMYVSHKAKLVAERIFLAGGFEGTESTSYAPPVTDAPKIDDPLKDRPAPFFSGCDHNNLIVSGVRDLAEGVYCGGLTIDGGNVRLFSGEYIIKDGPLTVKNGGILRGNNVGFYLTGDAAKLFFDYRSTINLTAPKTGILSGLLFFADASNATSSKEKKGKKLKSGHIIRSDDARRLVGTIYLPDDKIIVDGNEPVADRSEYTVILAKAFELNNGPNLVIKTDYDLSDIPVPSGVGPVSSDAIPKLVD